MIKAQIQNQLIFKLDVISSNNILFKKGHVVVFALWIIEAEWRIYASIN